MRFITFGLLGISAAAARIAAGGTIRLTAGSCWWLVLARLGGGLAVLRLSTLLLRIILLLICHWNLREEASAHSWEARPVHAVALVRRTLRSVMATIFHPEPLQR